MPHTHYYIDKHNKNDIRLNDNLIYTGYISDIQNWCSENQTHSFCELLYICDGVGTVYIDDIAYPVKKGDVVVYNRGTMHRESTGKDDPIKFIFIAFKTQVEDSLPPDHLISSDSCPVFSAGKAKYKLESLFTDLLNETKNHVEWYETMCETLLTSIIILTLRLQKSIILTNVSTNKECQTIKNFIDNNYSKNISLDALSDLVYISKHHLAHIFKKEIGMSPINYLISRRMQEAKIMLTDTDMSIHKIASNLGYENSSYFSQIFKKSVGISPLYYRKSQQSVKNK